MDFSRAMDSLGTKTWSTLCGVYIVCIMVVSFMCIVCLCKMVEGEIARNMAVVACFPLFCTLRSSSVALVINSLRVIFPPDPPVSVHVRDGDYGQRPRGRVHSSLRAGD